MPYPLLFQPLTLRNLTLRNRIVMAPMSTQLGSPEGLVTPEQVAFYRARAKGGTGMIIVEFCSVHRASGQSEPNQLALEDETHVASHRKLVRAIRDGGAVACLQLQHGGASAKRSHLQVDVPWGPNDIYSHKDPSRLVTRGMSHEDIEFIIECFGRSAELGVKAGYQAVELHGAHGYLITQFLSPRFNQREDAWGGSEFNRLEFPRRVIARVRKAIGNRPLILRISADEFTPKGLSIEDMERITPQLVSAGLDAIHVSLGIGPDSFDKVLESMAAPEGWRLPYARRIRDANHVPVIAVGQIRRPETAEQALAQGDTDLIALGRTLLADPDWANKARQDNAEDIIPCTSCNYCLTNGFQNHSIACANNPRTGRETAPQPRCRKRNQSAAVIGGGPGGMAAALLLTQAGYKTRLFEARQQLGGGLIASTAPPHKDMIGRYDRYLQRQLDKCGVELHLNQPIGINELIELAPDQVIIATGTPHLKPLDIHTDDGANPVFDAYALLMGEKLTLPAANAGPVLVYGGGETGCETAEYLLERDYEVVLVSRSPRNQLARAAEMIYRQDLLQRLLQHPRLTLHCDTHLLGYRDQQAYLQSSADGAETYLPVSALILAQGRFADNNLQEGLNAAGISATTIGDARQSGRIGDAVHDAWRAVSQLCLHGTI